MDWKKNFRRIPDRVSAKLNALGGRDVVVACVRKLSSSTIAAGTFAHLGIELNDERVTYPRDRVLPVPEAGVYSRRNRDGREIVRRDLPITVKMVTFETPNWGDWSNGSHDTTWSRAVYQREYEAPRDLSITVELLAEETENGEAVFVFRFQIDAVLRPSAPEFFADLLYALNVMQENVGAVDVFATDASRDDYLKTIYVAWELLPPGERDVTIAKFLSTYRMPSNDIRERLIKRYDLLAGLKPIAFVSGTSGFLRYFGAKFADDLVVFENLEYGNAIYVMFEDWQVLSQRSRLELLKGDTTKFVRIIHSKGWESELLQLIAERRPPRAA